MGKVTAYTFWEMTSAGGTTLRGSDLVSAAAGTTGQFGDGQTVTYLVVKEGQDLRQFVISPNSNVPKQIASIIGAEAKEVDEPDRHLFAAEATARLRIDRRGIVTRLNVADPDPSIPSKTLSQSMPDGSWVAVRTRHVTRRERKRQKRWLAYFLNTSVTQHPSLRPNSVIASIDVGASDRDDAKALADLMASVIPGFEYPTRVETTPILGKVAGGFIFGLAAAAAIVFGTNLPYILAELALGAGVVGGAVAALLARSRGGVSPMQAVRLFTSAPPSYNGAVRSPRKGQNSVLPDGSIVEKDGRSGSYPIEATTFMLSPDALVPLVAPLAGASTGSMRTRDRAVPSPFTKQIGVYLGNGKDGAPVHLDESRRWEGVFLLGQAGSGKSVTTHTLFAHDLMDHIAPSNRRGFPGRRHAMIAFENKGHDGAGEYLEWGRTLGARGASEVHLIDLMDPSTPAIDMLGHGTSRERAKHFVDAMQYAFGDQAIAFRSAETLAQVVCGALAVTQEMSDAVNLPTGGSWMDYAYVLLGGRGDEPGVALAGEIRSESVRLEAAGTPDRNLTQAAEDLAPLYGSATASVRRGLQEAPRNKFSQLLSIRQWWDPSRPTITWNEILNSHSVVVVNAGTSMNGDIVSGELSQIMSSMLMFSLRDSIMETCTGWRSAGRTVTLYADELKLLAGSSPDIITWLRDQGRAFGLRLVFATQYAEQLDPMVQNTVLGLATLILYRQGNTKIAETLAGILSVTGEEWNPSDIATLALYHAIIRSVVDGEVYQPFTVAMRNFDDDKKNFPFIQTDPARQAWSPDTRSERGPEAIVSNPAQAQRAIGSRPTVFGQEV